MSAKLFVATAAVLAGLAGCGDRQRDNPGTDAGQPPTPAGAVDPGKNTGTQPAHGAMTVKVLREDSEVGVAAAILRLDSEDKSYSFALVDDSGVTVLTDHCKSDDRFSARPRIPNYQETDPQACAAEITFRLYSTKTTVELIRLGDASTNSGDLVAAQAHYGLAAERLKYADPVESRHLKSLAATAAARVLGIATSSVPVGSGDTTSPALAKRFVEFQKQSGIPATGELDGPTRAAITKESPGAPLRLAQAAPATEAAVPAEALRSKLNAAQLQAVKLSPATVARQSEINRVTMLAH